MLKALKQKPDQQLIDQCKYLLEEAEKGTLRSLIAVYSYSNAEYDQCCHVENTHMPALFLSLSKIQHEILEQVPEN